jgi:hypothetical protein
VDQDDGVRGDLSAHDPDARAWKPALAAVTSPKNTSMNATYTQPLWVFT